MIHSLILPLMLLQQPSQPSSGVVQFTCRLGLSPDKNLSLSCGSITDVPKETKSDDLEYVLCEIRPAKIRRTLTVYPQDIELTYVDISKFTAGADPWVSTSQVSSLAAVDRATWEALPPEKQMGMIRQNPPNQYPTYMISAGCVKEILRIYGAKKTF